MDDAFLLGRVLLRFRSDSPSLLANLSAIASTPDGNLWLGSDELNLVAGQELNTIDRLTWVEPSGFADHQAFPLRDFLDLDDSAGEIDIEGLDFSGPYLWLTGSHSTKRKQPKGKNPAKDIERLAEISRDLNRYLIARIPVIQGQPYRSCTDPSCPDRHLTAAMLGSQKKSGNPLMQALAQDPHLGLYVASDLPSKENGFDVEGLAVRDHRLFLGLRGPVLRGWAIVLECALTASDDHTLELEPIAEQDTLYRKHFFDLDGLGIRDLCWQGEDLLILAGPTMDLAGAMRIYRWRGAGQAQSGIYSQAAGSLELVMQLPQPGRANQATTADKAEGICLIPWLDQAEALLTVYDSPDPHRLMGSDGVLADIFRLD